MDTHAQEPHLGPDFLLIGAMKAGTTSLFRYIKDHPQIQMPLGKELHFFSSPDVWAGGWDAYYARFPERRPATIAMGEASATYSQYPLFPEVPERIAARYPAMRLIYLVRHPVHRMQSHYLHRLRKGEEVRPIEMALLDDPRYMDASRYAMQIGRYLNHFPREQLLVLTTDALRDDRSATLRSVYEFLGVDPAWDSPVEDVEFNKGGDRGAVRPSAARLRDRKIFRRIARRAPRSMRRFWTQPVHRSQGSMTRETRAILGRRIAPDIAELRPFLPDTFDGWGLDQDQ